MHLLCWAGDALLCSPPACWQQRLGMVLQRAGGHGQQVGLVCVAGPRVYVCKGCHCWRASSLWRTLNATGLHARAVGPRLQLLGAGGTAALLHGCW